MNNKIDYYLHKSFDPTYYQRQFENDFPEKEVENSYLAVAQRASLIALPFISLYKPFGTAISLSMGTLRIQATLLNAYSASDIKSCAYHVAQVALTTLAIVGTIYNFTLGMFLTTGADLLSSLSQMIDHLSKCENKEAFETLLQSLSTTLYLATMTYGSLEIVIASILIQGAISLYQSQKEWSDGRVPEALAKTAMGMIRLYQAGGQYELLQRRNLLVKRYEEFSKRIQKGREIDHLWDHPILKSGIEGAILQDAEGNEYDFGDNYFGIGKQLVKGMNISFKHEDDKTTLEFKVGHVFRERLQASIDELEGADSSELQDLFKIFGSQAEGIVVKERQLESSSWMGVGDEYQIKLKGLGSIRIGADAEVITLYDRVTIEMDEGANIFDFHEALSLLNLDDALRCSADEDLSRMKMGYLFHIFAPRESVDFERSSDYFDLSIDEFKKAIFNKDPQMEMIFDKWLPKLELRETLPGKMRFALNGLADELNNFGGLGLTAALTGAFDHEELMRRAASILKMGMISSESRHRHDVGSQGLSWGADYYTGGADSVFTQAVTDKNKSFDDFMYSADVRFIFSREVFETGTYQYHDDSFGTRQTDDSWWWGFSEYKNRPNPFEFLNEERVDFNPDNEVMIKDRIPPEWITGMVVRDEDMKQNFLDFFRKKEIIQLDELGRETILGKLAEEFIWTGSKIDEDMFK